MPLTLAEKRLIQGLTLGAQPCFSALLAHWSPSGELSSRLIFTLSSQHLSNFLLNILAAKFCSFKSIFGGWPIGFLSSGVLGLLWCALWCKIGANDPEKHGKVSKKEIVKIVSTRDFNLEDKKAAISTFPWSKAICSKASLACLFCETSGTYGVACIVYYFPRYAHQILGFKMHANGLVTGIPSLLEFFCRLGFNFWAEYLTHSCKLDRTLVMKGFNTLGMLSIALLLYIATYVDCSHNTIAAALIILAQSFYGATSPGFLASQVLIAPKYAAIMAGWFTFISSGSMIGLPYLVAHLVEDSTNVSQWRLVFGIGCLAQLLSALFFIINGSAEEQFWAKSTVKLTNKDVMIGTNLEVKAASAGGP
uniref:Major facilitator superfamily (MFS) profile domain-containing protein n=1 Tax=Romanomermis culicivorax TaxID=13658 RepID=A0A915JL29_ROMCU